MKKYLIAILVLLGIGMMVSFEIGIIPEGSKRFLVSAEDGDAFAQAQLGQHYLMQGNDAEDLEWAAYWLERAASQDESQALYMLGMMRERGLYYQKDMAAALPFFLRAAMLNNGPAQEHLAQLFAAGLLGRPNYMESYKWYLLAARQGNSLDVHDFGAGQHLTAAQKQAAQRAADFLAARFIGPDSPAS